MADYEKKIVYPFGPKSTVFMRPGQFWSVPLKSGRYACGRVLQLDSKERWKSWRVGDDRSTLHLRHFHAGLMDWSGDTPPTEESIAGAEILEEGSAHIMTITANGGIIRGYRALELDGLEPALCLDQSSGRNCGLQRGFDHLGPASLEQQATLKTHHGWGYLVIVILAEKHFGSILPGAV